MKRLLLATTLLAAAACTATPPPATTMAPQPTAAAQTPAASPAGDWHGVLEIPPGAKLRIGVHVEETPAGGYSGKLASPDQGSSGQLMDTVTFADGAFAFTIGKRSWTGKWDTAQKAWVGEYTSSMGSFPLTLQPGVLPALPPNPAVAGLDGRWEGKVGDMLPIVLRVTTDSTGTVAVMDSPLQEAAGMAVPTFKRNGDTVSFEMPSIMASFTGKLSEAGDKITGTFHQGQDLPLEMKFISTDVTPAVMKERPQTPKKPYPYQEIETGYDNPANPGVHIPCTLTVPEGAGPHPAALLLSGSGAQDRDETLLGHKPFLVLADHLTRKGVAVMRCDDRDFVHPNVKEPLASTIPEFVTDAEAALKVLRARPEIDPKRVGVIGHSEGGITGPRVAAQDKEVAFVVTLAGVGVKGRDALTEQRALIAKSYGATEEELAQGRRMSNEIFDAVLNAPDTGSAKAAVIAVLKASPTSPDKPAPTEASFQAAADEFASPYLRDLLAYDPSLYVPKVAVPFLAVNGSKDLQVAPEQNLSGFKTLLANNKDATFIELPGLNHLFQTVTTGAIAEYGDIDETFSPTALDTVSDWIVKRMQP